MAAAAGGALLVTGSTDARVRIWDVPHATCRNCLAGVTFACGPGQHNLRVLSCGAIVRFFAQQRSSGWYRTHINDFSSAGDDADAGHRGSVTCIANDAGETAVASASGATCVGRMQDQLA